MAETGMRVKEFLTIIGRSKYRAGKHIVIKLSLPP
jgi:hypothetical protein